MLKIKNKATMKLDADHGEPEPGPYSGTKLLEDRMGNTPHELIEEFPEHAEKISNLKASDTRFAKLFDDYHKVNRAVHRAESNVAPMEDLAQVDLRKQRAALKDEIYRYLTT